MAVTLFQRGGGRGAVGSPIDHCRHSTAAQHEKTEESTPYCKILQDKISQEEDLIFFGLEFGDFGTSLSWASRLANGRRCLRRSSGTVTGRVELRLDESVKVCDVSRLEESKKSNR
jgi:hypothetical protein